MNRGKLMSAKEVCDYLGISKLTLYRLIQAREITGFKVGGRWRFSEDDLEAYIIHSRITQTGVKYPGLVFHNSVLIKYYHTPRKYRIVTKGPIGWLNVHKKHLDRLSPADRAREGFDQVKYKRIRLPNGVTAVLIMPGYFDRLPKEEQEHWRKFEILP